MKKILKSFLKKIVFGCIFPLVYRWNTRKPICEKSVLFIEIRYDKLTNNFSLLWDLLSSMDGVSLELICLGNSIYPYKTYLKKCFSMLATLARAQYVIVDESSNVLAALPIRKETKMIQVWHGCGAFKRFGHGIEGGLQEAYYNAYDLVTVSSPEVVDIYASSMNQEESVVKPLGVSRTDVFFSKAYIENSMQAIRKKYSIISDKKIVLYAPTFRGNVQNAQAPRMLDIGKMYDSLSDSHVILYKGHPSIRTTLTIEDQYKNFFVDASKDEIEMLMCAADCCITDYSSLVFEYALLERPMFFYAYDYKEYVDDRGFYYDYESFVPGPICYDEEDLLNYMKTEVDLNIIDVFKERFMSACDGQATNRIIKWMFPES